MNFDFRHLKAKYNLQELSTFVTNGKINPFPVFLLLILSIVSYILFIIFTPFISHFQGSFDRNNITPWILDSMKENDGIELYVMTLAMPAYLLTGYLVTKYFNYGFPHQYVKSIFWFCVAFVPILFIANFIYKEAPLPYFRLSIIFILTFYAAKLLIRFSQYKFTVFTRFFIVILLFCLVTFLGILINSPAHIFDYSYFIGPANKILAGESPGSFYMQYNLLETSLFLLLQKCNLQIHQMLFVMIIIFSIWILFYLKAAVQLFRNNVFVWLFLFTLIIVRCIAISEGPVSIPQVSPLRLDLWVPLLIVISIFGFESVLTALVFSSFYFADDVFGLLYLLLFAGIHLLKIAVTFIKKKPLDFAKTTSLIIPLICALGLHYLLFGSISSPAGKIYSAFHIGFMPVSFTSSFWLLAVFLPICLYILSKDKSKSEIIIFIFGIACIQLTYFFGRSHDHNLLNISGIFVFILFLTIDFLYNLFSRPKWLLAYTTLLIAGIAVNFNTAIMDKYYLAKSKISKRVLIEPSHVEENLAFVSKYFKLLNTDKIVILSDIDAYVNYRTGLRQVGYFSPFCANIKLDETVAFLIQKQREGYRLILYPGENYNLADQIKAMNTNPIIKIQKGYFNIAPLPLGLNEVKFTEDQIPKK